MSYTVINFKTKKQVREAVKHWINFLAHKERLIILGGQNAFEPSATDANPIRCYNPGLGPDLSNHTGRVSLEGQHYPKPHTWYAEGEMVNGILVKVK